MRTIGARARLRILGVSSSVLVSGMFFLTMVSAWATASATVPQSVTQSNVVWPDADYQGELGSLPLGNGDLAANVWVDSASGDLMAYLAKSDAFDQNSQPIKQVQQLPQRLIIKVHEST